MSQAQTERMTMVTVLQPVADAYASDPATDVVNLKYYRRATFLVVEAAGGTGTVKIEVEECTSKAGAGNNAIAFKYRLLSDGDQGALTASAATGYTTTAGANKLIAVEVDAADLADGSPYCRLQLTEVADSPCLAGVICILSEPRYASDSLTNPLS
jgi:hypothetical protein